MLVNVLVIGPVKVIFIEPVLDTDTVDVLLFDELFVAVLDLKDVLDIIGLYVDVLDNLDETELVPEADGDFVLVMVLVPDGDDVPVLDEVVVEVVVRVKIILKDSLDDLLTLAEAEDVFELLTVLVVVPLLDCVLDTGPDLLLVGLADGDFDDEVDEVPVLELVVVLVDVLLPEFVFVIKALWVDIGEDELDFEFELVLVDVIVAVVVFVEVGDGVTNHVLWLDLEVVVVLVDVFELVGDEVVNALKTNKDLPWCNDNELEEFLKTFSLSIAIIPLKIVINNINFFHIYISI